MNCTKDGDLDLNAQDSLTAQPHGQLKPGGREEVPSCCAASKGPDEGRSLGVRMGQEQVSQVGL